MIFCFIQDINREYMAFCNVDARKTKYQFTSLDLQHLKQGKIAIIDYGAISS